MKSEYFAYILQQQNQNSYTKHTGMGPIRSSLPRWTIKLYIWYIWNQKMRYPLLSVLQDLKTGQIYVQDIKMLV